MGLTLDYKSSCILLGVTNGLLTRPDSLSRRGRFDAWLIRITWYSVLMLKTDSVRSNRLPNQPLWVLCREGRHTAMPLGDGYTVEEQLTGEAEHGGIQLIVYPMKYGTVRRTIREEGR